MKMQSCFIHRRNKPKQTQPVAAKPPCRGEVLHEAAMAKPDQTQFIPAESKRSADPYGWTSRNPQIGDQTEHPSRGEVPYEGGLAKPKQTQFHTRRRFSSRLPQNYGGLSVCFCRYYYFSDLKAGFLAISCAPTRFRQLFNFA